MFNGKIRTAAALSVLALGLGACASPGGYPDNPTTVGQDLAPLVALYFDPNEIVKYRNTTDPILRKTKRNEIIYGRMAAYDIEFAKFQQDINAERTLTDTTGDLTTLALTALGATLASAATKTALAAAATAVNGGRLAIDKNVFYDKTLPALFAQMDANRLTVRAAIEAGLNQDDINYPLTKGLTELITYREAGSLPGAVSGITAQAGAQKAMMQDRLLARRGL